MLKQKGQAIVEFVIVLPFFLFVFFTMIYLSFCFLDYFTIHEIARSSAREAAIQGSAKYLIIHDNYIKEYENETWFSDGFYTWKAVSGSNSGDFTIVKESNTNMNNPVVTKIILRRNDTVTGVTLLNMVFTLPETLTVEYKMHDETSAGTS